MKYLLLAFLISTSAMSIVRPAKIVAELEESIGDQDRLMQQTTYALDNLVSYAVQELMDRGFEFEAMQIQTQWTGTYRDTLLSPTRDIPNNPPMIEFLDKVMNTIISKIGREFCVASHICDIYSINKVLPVAINVITKRCNFPVTENSPRKDWHRQCMATDGNYVGLYPIIVFWIIEGAGGFTPVTGILAMVGENIMKNYIAGPLADRLYGKLCPNTP